jgi:hypothetical protein
MTQGLDGRKRERDANDRIKAPFAPRRTNTGLDKTPWNHGLPVILRVKLSPNCTETDCAACFVDEVRRVA